MQCWLRFGCQLNWKHTRLYLRCEYIKQAGEDLRLAATSDASKASTYSVGLNSLHGRHV